MYLLDEESSLSDLTRSVINGRIKEPVRKSGFYYEYDDLRDIVLTQRDSKSGIKDMIARAFTNARPNSKERDEILNIVRTIEDRRYNLRDRDRKLLKRLLY